MRKKRTFILLELMIALGLSAILLTVLFRFFVNCVKMDQKIDRASQTLHSYQQFQTRLSSLFTSLVPSSTLSHPVPAFYTPGEQALVAIFDNGIDPDPAFSGPILCKLFIDEGNLALAFWPLEKTDPAVYRKELLLSNVQGLQFQFLTQKNIEHPDPHAKPINASMEWRTNWPKNLTEFPSVVRLSILQSDNHLNFAFHLPIRMMISFREERTAT